MTRAMNYFIQTADKCDSPFPLAPLADESCPQEARRCYVLRQVRKPAKNAKGKSRTNSSGSCGTDRTSNENNLRLGVGQTNISARRSSSSCANIECKTTFFDARKINIHKFCETPLDIHGFCEYTIPRQVNNCCATIHYEKPPRSSCLLDRDKSRGGFFVLRHGEYYARGKKINRNHQGTSYQY